MMKNKNIANGVCPVCQGNSELFSDYINGYSVEIDARHQEMLILEEGEHRSDCEKGIPISYCPACGRKLKEE